MDEGQRDEWAAAVTLALLDHAAAQRRPFGLITFTGRIVGETLVPVGGTLPREALTVPSEGATDISTAVARGLDIIAAGAQPFRWSDLVLITDGGSSPDAAPDLRERARALQVTVLGVAIGMPAESLAPWCDDFQGATTLTKLDNKLAASLFAA
jgi:uncharacterized protein with von Willebrand factor type A (vWA) domain